VDWSCIMIVIMMRVGMGLGLGGRGGRGEDLLSNRTNFNTVSHSSMN
jgi:hypothetical protein